MHYLSPIVCHSHSFCPSTPFQFSTLYFVFVAHFLKLHLLLSLDPPPLQFAFIVWLWCITRLSGSIVTQQNGWLNDIKHDRDVVMLLKSDVKTFDEAFTGESRQAGRGVICKVEKSNFARREDYDGRKLKLIKFSGGAVITNPPLNQNKTEGDLVNFSCEGEVTKNFLDHVILIFENVSKDINLQKKQGTPGNLTISWYRDNIPIRSVSSMQVMICTKLYAGNQMHKIPQKICRWWYAQPPKKIPNTPTTSISPT